MTERKKPTQGRLSNQWGNSLQVRKSAIRSTSAKILILWQLPKLQAIKTQVKTSKTAKRVKANTLSSKRQQSQLERVVDCFAERPRTMLDVALTTGIFRANICRYVAKLRRAGRIQIHHYGIDAITKCPAGFLTTNPALLKSMLFHLHKDNKCYERRK